MNLTRSSTDSMTNFQATLVNAGYGQLSLRDCHGKIAQKWILGQPKCVIGSNVNCNVRCQLPGVADHHVLLVIGAKQVFLRALTPGIQRDGKALSELVLSGEQIQFAFDVAGHRFEYMRQHCAPITEKRFVQEGSAPATRIDIKSAAETSDRLKFTFVRALEKNRGRSGGLGPSARAPEALANTERPAWVEEIVRDALRPVELRLENMVAPIQSLERQLRRQRARLRKQTKSHHTTRQAAHDMPDPHTLNLIESQETIQKIVRDQTLRLETVNERVADIVSQLAALERIVSAETGQHHEEVSRTTQAGEEIMRLQHEMLALISSLQSRAAEPRPADQDDTLWRSSVQRQLDELHASLSVLDDIKSSIQTAVVQNRELTQDFQARWQALEEAARRPVIIQTLPAVNAPADAQTGIAPSRGFQSASGSYVAPAPEYSAASAPAYVPPFSDDFESQPQSFAAPVSAAGDALVDMAPQANAYEPTASAYSAPHDVDAPVDHPIAVESAPLPAWWTQDAEEPSDKNVGSDSGSAYYDDTAIPLSTSENQSNSASAFTDAYADKMASGALGNQGFESDVQWPTAEQELRQVSGPVESKVDESNVDESNFDVSNFGESDSAETASSSLDDYAGETNESAADDLDEPGYNIGSGRMPAGRIDELAYDAQDEAYRVPLYDDQDYSNDVRDEDFASASPTVVDGLNELGTTTYDLPERNWPVDGSAMDQYQATNSPEEVVDSGNAYEADLQVEDYDQSAFSAEQLAFSEPLADYSSDTTERQRELDDTQSVARTTVANPAREGEAAHEENADESVEDYMRRLLARMRGVSESEVKLPGLETKDTARAEPKPQAPIAPAGALGSDDVLPNSYATEALSEAWTEPFDPEQYVPRGVVQERNRDISALRELANTSARSAIQVSARRRHSTAILIKSSVSLVGLFVGLGIVSINGLRVNIALIATIASFLVAAIWGYDALATLRPLLQASRQPKTFAQPSSQASTQAKSE